MNTIFCYLSLFLNSLFFVLCMEVMLTRETFKFVKTCGYDIYPNWKCLKKVVFRLLFYYMCRRQKMKFILRKNRKSSKKLFIIVAKKYILRPWNNSLSYVGHVNRHCGCSCCILTISRSHAISRYCFTLTAKFLEQKNVLFLYTVLTFCTYKTFRFARRRNGAENNARKRSKKCYSFKVKFKVRRKMITDTTRGFPGQRYILTRHWSVSNSYFQPRCLFCSCLVFTACESVEKIQFHPQYSIKILFKDISCFFPMPVKP